MGLFKKRKGSSPEQEPGQALVNAQALAEQMRGGRVTARNVASMVRSAHELQRQGMAAQQAMQQGSGVGAVLAALGIHWDSDYAKRVDCPSCGAPKRLPSPSAYLYCDYCGALADFDFRLACDQHALPGPAYQALVAQKKAELDGAKAAGDRDRYRAAQMQIYDAYVDACPGAVSHRVKDPGYRAAYVGYVAESSVVTDFDPTYAGLMDEVTRSATGLVWTGSMLERKVESSSFRVMVDACDRHAARANELYEQSDLRDRDPDHAPADVRERMRASLLCQGWLPMLVPDDARWMIDHLHLDGEYQKLEAPADGETRSCAVCGHEVTALPGAKVTVCGGCGRQIDVGGAATRCGGCGGVLSFPVGTSRVNCPHCRSEAARVGLT